MADTTLPTNVTPTPPAPAPAAAPAGEGLGGVRTGLAAFVAAAGLFLLGVAAYYFINATTLGATEGPTADSWAEGFKHREVWPIAIWSLVFGLAGVAFTYLLFTGQGRADRDTPAWLSRMRAFTLFAGALCLLCLPIYLLITRSTSTAITPAFIWAALGFFVLAIGGVLALLEGPSQEEGRLRMLLLGIGLSLGA